MYNLNWMKSCLDEKRFQLVLILSRHLGHQLSYRLV